MIRQSTLRFLAALFAALSCSPLAVAQTPEKTPAEVPSAEPPASPDAPAAAVNDVVLLKSGGMARGTIVEMDPNGSVSLMLLNGQSRTWPMTEVVYAGPYSRMPDRAAAAAAPATSTAPREDDSAGPGEPALRIISGKAHLRLTSSQRGVTYYVEGGAGAPARGFTRLCTAPCQVELAEGEYTFAISRGGSSPVRVKPLRVKGTMRLDGTHWSNESGRTAGWIVFGAGLGVGIPLMAWGLQTAPDTHCQNAAPSQHCTESNAKKTALTWFGVGLQVFGLAVGLPTALGGDDATIKAVVGAPAPLPARQTSQLAMDPDERTQASALSGMTLVGSF